MDGVSRTLGVGPTIELGGRTYSVSGRILRHYAEIEAEIRRLRGDPIASLSQLVREVQADEAAVTTIVMTALQHCKRANFVTLDEIGEFLEQTQRGRCMTVYLAIRDNDRKALTLDVVSELVCDRYEDELRRKPELSAEGKPTELFGADRAEAWWDQITRAIDLANGDEAGNSTGSPSDSRTPEASQA